MTKTPKRLMPWSETLIVLERQTVGEMVESSHVPGYPRARLNYALEKLVELESSDDSLSQLHAFLLAQAALEHHAQDGGLTPTELRRVTNAATSILRVMQINQDKSNLAFLYADLHAALARIHSQEGDSWSAAWELWQAGSIVSARRGQSSAASLIEKGLLLLRRAQVKLATAHFDRALQQPSSHDDLARSYIGLARCARLAGDGDQARNSLKNATSLLGVAEEIRSEIAWETIRLETFKQEPRVALMLDATQTDAPHFVAHRVVEASLVARSVASRAWLKDIRSMRRLSRYKTLEMSKHQPLHRAAIALEMLHDVDVPLRVRILKLGEVLEDVATLPNIELEMLTLAAAARWLQRNQAYPMAELVLGEYHGRSLMVSDGRSRDALQLMSDLKERSWMLANDGDAA